MVKIVDKDDDNENDDDDDDDMMMMMTMVRKKVVGHPKEGRETPRPLAGQIFSTRFNIAAW